MVGEWKSLPVAELYDFSSGLSKPSSAFGSGYPFLAFKDIFYNSAVPPHLTELVNSTEEERSRSSVRRGDVFLTRTSETMDELGMSSVALRDVPDATFNGFTKRLRPKNSQTVVPEYARYYFRGPTFRQAVTAMSSMSTRASLNNEMLSRLSIALPPRDEQAAIGHILGTLDDKIEVNRRMSETLEAMARALFKSWFVAFDPVRAKMEGRDPGLPKSLSNLFPDRLVDSGLGEIPEGWGIGRVDDEFNLTMGQSPPGETYNVAGDGVPFYQGRADFESRFPKRRVYCTAPTRLAQKGDTLVSVRAPVGDINMAFEDCAIGRGVAAARHRSGSRSYTYQFMLGLEEVFTRFEAEGTVFGSISKKDFHAIPCVVVPPEIVAAFERALAPLDDRVEIIMRQCGSLACLRDALLPKLISGELRLSLLPAGAEHVTA